MSTPVTPLTSVGMHCTMLSTSPVSLAAPTSLPPQDTIVTLLTCDKGAATSAATCTGQRFIVIYTTVGDILLSINVNRNRFVKVYQTLGKVSSIISTMAADPYSFQASAFLAICSASAAALALIAYASACETCNNYVFSLCSNNNGKV